MDGNRGGSLWIIIVCSLVQLQNMSGDVDGVAFYSKRYITQLNFRLISLFSVFSGKRLSALLERRGLFLVLLILTAFEWHFLSTT